MAFSQSRRRLLDSGDYSDLALVCQGRELMVHRGYVCIMSPVIKELCDQAIASGPEGCVPRVELADVNVEALSRVMEFIYTGNYSSTGSCLHAQLLEPTTSTKTMATNGDAAAATPISTLPAKDTTADTPSSFVSPANSNTVTPAATPSTGTPNPFEAVSSTGTRPATTTASSTMPSIMQREKRIQDKREALEQEIKMYICSKQLNITPGMTTATSRATSLTRTLLELATPGETVAAFEKLCEATAKDGSDDLRAQMTGVYVENYEKSSGVTKLATLLAKYEYTAWVVLMPLLRDAHKAQSVACGNCSHWFDVRAMPRESSHFGSSTAIKVTCKKCQPEVSTKPPTGGLFGSAPAGGLFGSASSTGLFGSSGTTKPTNPITGGFSFGQSFASRSSSGVSGSTTVPHCPSTALVPYQVTQQKDSFGIMENFQSINFMESYSKQSFEELRMTDYEGFRKHCCLPSFVSSNAVGADVFKNTGNGSRDL